MLRAARRIFPIVVMALALACVITRQAYADDSADEADLQFQLGARHYQNNEFEQALEHFLVSNRLVPNRNVVYNIARTYEKLGRFPEAYRYYSQALEGETDAASRARIEEALKKIAVNVAVIDIVTEPAGATIYLDRRDLGPRGSSPRKLGMAPGTYKIIADLVGYLPAEAVVKDVKAGETTSVKLQLVPVLGVLHFEGIAGASVHVGTVEAPASCQIPCDLKLPPGHYELFVSHPGHRTKDVSADVVADRTMTVRPDLEVLTGTLVVGTDEPGALIEIDGAPHGFTPAILTLPAGPHRAVLRLQGFRPAERPVDIPVNGEARLDVALTRSDEVVAASRVSEDVEHAPSSVTIVPRREIVTMSYPTIYEALRGVRGVYVWDDRTYATIGFRGLGRLGGYGNRVLVTYDGHPVNDNWLGSSYVGFDARTDLADVERIEVVRGPGSALYGTNAFSGVVNVVTRYRDVPPGVEVGVSSVLDGVARARVRGDMRFGKDAGAWMSIAAARSRGRDFFFPEFVTPMAPDSGHARNVDRLEAGTAQGRVYWKWLTAQYFLQRHTKHLPTGEFDTLLGDDRTRQTDTRSFVEARADPDISDTLSLMTRLHWNYYGFDGFYARAPADGGVEEDTFHGQWVGLEQRAIVKVVKQLTLTAGAEGQIHYQVEQRAKDDSGYFLDDSGKNQRDYQVGAAYGVVDADPSETVRLSVGARLDAYSTFGTSVSPRAALIVAPYDRGSTKFLVGRAFRAPSIYELYYNDDGFTQIAAPDLKPELVYSGEIEHTHRFSTTVTGTVGTFVNYVTDIIVTRGAGTMADPLQYDNSSSPLAVVGGEAEVRRDWRQGWMVGASYTLQHARFLKSDSLGDLFVLKKDPASREVSNVPAHLIAIKGALPIVRRLLVAGTRLTIEGTRYDRFESVADPEEQRKTDAFAVWDVVLSGEEPRFGLHYSLGVYNAFDWRYSLPVSAEFTQRTIEQNGRTFLATADVKF